MEISYSKYSLELRHQFTISYNSRKSTPIVLIKIEHDGIVGYGEASLPPYLQETQETVITFLKSIAKKNIGNISDYKNIINTIDGSAENNTAAKAAVDIALHDLFGQINQKPCYQLFDLTTNFLPMTSFTIGIDEPKILKQKIAEASKFKIFKIKLGTEDDKKIVRAVREETDKPLYADINQGWSDKYFALEMSEWLHQQNILLIEQPFNKNDFEKSAWLSERSPIPIIADESVQRYSDIEKIKNSFNGINIKLMKCTGINEAYKMIMKAQECDLKVMMGCMTETSCGISAAAQLSSLVDFADLDGNLLLTNDPFNAVTVDDGRLHLSGKNGLGIDLKEDLPFTEL
ncbi:MAG: dipeptide epimerase [Ignavibacteriales bacterium]|nr:dipeptide epimerase [Ignavibacteriales bacterium]